MAAAPHNPRKDESLDLLNKQGLVPPAQKGSKLA